MIAGVSHLARLGRAGFVLAREGVLALVDTSRLPLPARAAVRMARLVERPASRNAANRLAAALTRLGPSYVKLGQFLATRPDVVGRGDRARSRSRCRTKWRHSRAKRRCVASKPRLANR